MAVRLASCCCGCSLKEGAIVVGVLFLVLTATALLCDVYFAIRYSAEYDGDRSVWYTSPPVVVPVLITTLVCCGVQTVTTALLLRGVVKYDRRLVLPWLVVNAVLCGLLFLSVVGGTITIFITTAANISGDLTTAVLALVILVLGAVIVGLYVYFMLVVYSFYCVLPMMSSERIAFLLNRFNNPYLHQEDDTSSEHWPNARSGHFSGY